MPYLVKHRTMALYVGPDGGIVTKPALAQPFESVDAALAERPECFEVRFHAVAVPARPEIEEAAPDMFAQADADARGKREGMAQAALHASQRWEQAAYDAVVFVSGVLPDFTAADVWAALRGGERDPIEGERNPVAMGAVMARVARDRLITQTGEYRPTGHHKRPQAVWRKTTTQEYRRA
jgi:hypothetical protein